MREFRFSRRARITPEQAGLPSLDRADPGHPPARRLEENLAAANLELSADDLAQIDSTASQITVEGARYPEAMQRLIDR